MNTITPFASGTQVGSVPISANIEPSAYGGVLVMAKAWAVLGGQQLTTGIRWQGKGGALLLFMLVVLPILSPRSIRAVANFCAKTARSAAELVDPLWWVLDWGLVVTQRRVDRFASSPRHDWFRVLGTMIGALTLHPATKVGKDGIIAVDSTTVEKRYGPKLEGIRPVYDSVQKRLVDGYEIVSACVVHLKKVSPIGLLPHRKADSEEERRVRRRRKAAPEELPSKLDLALSLVKVAVAAGVTASTVVGDSAFSSMWWLQEVVALGLHWLVSVRNDRRLRIGAEIRKFRDWAREMPLQLVESCEGSTVWGGLLPRGTMLKKSCNQMGLLCQPAYFERRDRQGRVVHRWYLVTSQLAWGLEGIWQHWSWRWSIEVFHRESKQLMRLADFHVRTWEAIVALIACTSLRASLLYFIRAMEPCCHDLSMEQLVAALREAPSLVERLDTCRVIVSMPPRMQVKELWNAPTVEFPVGQWPIELKAA